MKVITSFNQKLYNEYAHKAVESFKNWPEEAKLIIYSEDMTGESSDRIEWRDLNFPDLVAFKTLAAMVHETAYGTGKPEPIDYRYDAARFANKVWALTHGTLNETGLCFWLDADCVTYRKISGEFLRRLTPPQFYLGYFGRDRVYPETGFISVRCNHECHKDFMASYKDLYTSEEIFKLPQWHDGYVFGWLLDKKKVPALNLSGEFSMYGHPMAKVRLAKYIDHQKGDRKAMPSSPENMFRR